MTLDDLLGAISCYFSLTVIIVIIIIVIIIIIIVNFGLSAHWSLMPP